MSVSDKKQQKKPHTPFSLNHFSNYGQLNGEMIALQVNSQQSTHPKSHSNNITHRPNQYYKTIESDMNVIQSANPSLGIEKNNFKTNGLPLNNIMDSNMMNNLNCLHIIPVSQTPLFYVPTMNNFKFLQSPNNQYPPQFPYPLNANPNLLFGNVPQQLFPVNLVAVSSHTTIPNSTYSYGQSMALNGNESTIIESSNSGTISSVAQVVGTMSLPFNNDNSKNVSYIPNHLQQSQSYAAPAFPTQIPFPLAYQNIPSPHNTNNAPSLGYPTAPFINLLPVGSVSGAPVAPFIPSAFTNHPLIPNLQNLQTLPVIASAGVGSTYNGSVNNGMALGTTSLISSLTTTTHTTTLSAMVNSSNITSSIISSQHHHQQAPPPYVIASLVSTLPQSSTTMLIHNNNANIVRSKAVNASSTGEEGGIHVLPNATTPLINTSSSYNSIALPLSHPMGHPTSNWQPSTHHASKPIKKSHALNITHPETGAIFTAKELAASEPDKNSIEFKNKITQVALTEKEEVLDASVIPPDEEIKTKDAFPAVKDILESDYKNIIVTEAAPTLVGVKEVEMVSNDIHINISNEDDSLKRLDKIDQTDAKVDSIQCSTVTTTTTSDVPIDNKNISIPIKSLETSNAQPGLNTNFAPSTALLSDFQTPATPLPNNKISPTTRILPSSSQRFIQYTKTDLLKMKTLVDVNECPVSLVHYDFYVATNRMYNNNMGNKRNMGGYGMVNDMRMAFPRNSVYGRSMMTPEPLPTTKQVEYIPAKDAWRASHRRTETNPETAETEMIVGKVKSLLNKISPNNFNQLLDEFKSLALHINSLDRVTGVVKVIFHKALLEPAFVDMYALLLQALCACCEPFKPLCIILTMCQKQFEAIKSEKSEEELEFEKKIQEATDENEKRILEEDLNEYILKERDRYLGNIKFVSELLKLQLLTPKIFLDCLVTLYNVKTDIAYEGLCNMLRYAGKDFESHPGQRIVEEMINNFKKLSKDNNISSRIRFMMTDIIDLKENGWVPRRDEDAPRTYEEIEMEMARENEETRKMAASVLKRQHLQSKGGGNVNRMGETPSPNLYNNNTAGSNSIMSSGLSSNAGMSPMPEFKNLAHRPVGIHSRQEQNLDTIKLGPSKWVRNTSTNANKQISANVKTASPASTTPVSVLSNATRNVTAENINGSFDAFKNGKTNISKGAIPNVSMVPSANAERKKSPEDFLASLKYFLESGEPEDITECFDFDIPTLIRDFDVIYGIFDHNETRPNYTKALFTFLQKSQCDISDIQSFIDYLIDQKENFDFPLLLQYVADIIIPIYKESEYHPYLPELLSSIKNKLTPLDYTSLCLALYETTTSISTEPSTFSNEIYNIYIESLNGLFNGKTLTPSEIFATDSALKTYLIDLCSNILRYMRKTSTGGNDTLLKSKGDPLFEALKLFMHTNESLITSPTQTVLLLPILSQVLQQKHKSDVYDRLQQDSELANIFNGSQV